jgi:tetratricopeptide (TPR) repeat protein
MNCEIKYRTLQAVIGALIAAALMVPAVCSAQDDAQLAQEAFDRGMSHYTEENYGDAVAEFRKGHQLMPNGLFLYNISLSYMRLGNHEKALRYAERAVEMRDHLPPKSDARNSARMGALRARLSAIGLAGRLEPQETEPTDDRDDLLADAESDNSQETEGWPGTLTYIGAGTAALGGALIISAGVMGSDIDARIDQLGDTDDRQSYDAMRSEIESDRSVGRVLLFSGIGLVAAGGGLVAWDLYGGESETTLLTLQPEIGGDRVGARLDWQW